MTKLSKRIALLTTVGVIAISGAVFADAFKSPVDILSALTGKTTQSLYDERSQGKTFGTIAKDAGKLDEFKAQTLEQKKLILDQRVKDGKITKESADKIYAALKDNQVNCDGDGASKIGQKYGAGFGNGSGNGDGVKLRDGSGSGKGQGKGFGRGMNR